MSTISYAVSDSATMLRRNLRHMQRYPSMTMFTLLTPILMLLIFVYVFGTTLNAGLGGAGSDQGYVDYFTPGILLITATSGCMAAAVSVSMDMTEGIINRFRTMSISRGSVLTGHVVGCVIQTMASIVLLLAVALLVGFRPSAGPLEWLAVAGLLVVLTFGLSWVSVLIGLATGGPEAASNMIMPVQFLPLLGSAVVPTESMPVAIRWFAEYQPFTPMIETLRGLLLGTPIGSSAVLSVVWCVVIALVGYLGSRWLFARKANK